jgi:hypothetical protein
MHRQTPIPATTHCVAFHSATDAPGKYADIEVVKEPITVQIKINRPMPAGVMDLSGSIRLANEAALQMALEILLKLPKGTIQTFTGDDGAARFVKSAIEYLRTQ